MCERGGKDDGKAIIPPRHPPGNVLCQETYKKGIVSAFDMEFI